MEVIWRKLKENTGEVAPHLAVIMVIGVILLAAALEINRVYVTVDQVINKTNASVVSVAAHNVSQVAAGVREGVGTARTHTATGWSNFVSTNDVVTSLCKSLGATKNGTALEIENGAYRVLDVDTIFTNTDNGKLNFKTTLTLEIRLSLGGTLLPPIKKPLEVHSTYEAKF